MLRSTLAISAFAMMLSASASQPLRRTITLTTEDGQTVSVVKRGGPDFSWWESADGKCYELSRNADGNRAGRVLKAIANPCASVLDGQRMHKAMSASTEDGLGEYGTSGKGVVSSLGSPVIPVIMVAFNDLDFLPGNDEAKITRFLNEEGYKDEQYAVGSVADYFKHCSFGLFTPRFEVVAKVTLSQGYQYYGEHAGSQNDAKRMEAVKEAVALAEAQGVDFSKYGANGHAPLISLLHAGPGEQEDWGDDADDYFWAHFLQTSISANTTKFDSYLLTNESMRDIDNSGNVKEEKMTGIGTFCHEFSHALGLPDMYDVNGDRDGEAETPGYWDVMDYQFMYDGYRPMEYSAYERSMMGWMQVEELNAANAEQEFTLLPLNSTSAEGNKMYCIVNPVNDKEYFLLANRQACNFMQGSHLGHGMIVWHILYDSNAWASNVVNTKAERQRVRVVPADGTWQATSQLNKKDAYGQRYTFTGDLFPGYTGRTTFDNTLDTFFEGDFDLRIVDIKESADGVITFRTTTEPDGIVSVTTAARGNQLYDLSGRSVKEQHAHGVYVSDGKKIVK